MDGLVRQVMCALCVCKFKLIKNDKLLVWFNERNLLVISIIFLQNTQ